MNTSPTKRWALSLDVFETPDGPEITVQDGRTTLVGGTDAQANLRQVVALLTPALQKLQNEADGVKAS